MDAALVDCVRNSLAAHCYSNAAFLCERLCAVSPTDANKHLLATCYHRMRRLPQAYHALKGTRTASCQYLLAVTCFDLHMLPEAEALLLRLVPAVPTALGPPLPAPPLLLLLVGIDMPVSMGLHANKHFSGSGGLMVDGQEDSIVVVGTSTFPGQSDRKSAAMRYFNAALASDPFFWSAFEELCALGAEAEASEAFSDKVALKFESQRRAGQGDGGHEGQAEADCIGLHADGQRHTGKGGAAEEPSSGNDGYETPDLTTPITAALDQHSFLEAASPRTPAAPVAGIAQRRKFVDEGKLRKVSGRLFAEPPGAPRRSTRLAEGGPSFPLTGSGDRPPGVEGAGAPVEGPAPAGAGAAPGGRSEQGGEVAGGMARGAAGVQRGAEAPGRRPVGPESRPFEPEDVLLAGHRDGTAEQARARDAAPSQGAVDDSQVLVESAGSETMGNGAPPRVGDVTQIGRVWPRVGPRGSDFDADAAADTSEVQSPPPVSLRTGRGGNECGGGEGCLIGALELLRLLRVLGTALVHISFLRGKQGIETLKMLPRTQFSTHWVLSLVGKAHTDVAEFVDAERAFRQARQLAPYTLDHLDTYSTVLYQLKEDTLLSSLAQEALAIDRLAPQPWCVMGNLLSLHKEHDSALRFFRRALQIDPGFKYAHTLCGHEHMVLEEFEDAAGCFRAALRLDPRHYTAWYGLGMVYMKQEKFDMAEHHFRRALRLNPRNSVLLCYLGTALHALKRNDEAHHVLKQAIQHGPFNPLPKYQRAQVLLAEEKLHEALEAAKELLHVAPQEPSIYFLLGKIYKRLEEQEKAILHLSMALDLKPPTQEVNLIKAFIEKLNVPDSLGNGDEDDE